jgi:hypothetical protein
VSPAFLLPLILAAADAFSLSGCSTARRQAPTHATIPHLRQAIVIDGRLSEPCYAQAPLVDQFVAAGAPNKPLQPTRAWLFWNSERLVFAFDVVDADVVATEESHREHDVDQQDRIELFLWSGRTNDAYFCIEIGARGAVHDYSARFYRRFDDTWSPAEWRYAVTATAGGYQVEGELLRAAMERMGFRLAPRERLRAGLFRADFRSGMSEPIWVCWVDANGAQPDFHVPESFGEIILAP